MSFLESRTQGAVRLKRDAHNGRRIPQNYNTGTEWNEKGKRGGWTPTIELQRGHKGRGECRH